MREIKKKKSKNYLLTFVVITVAFVAIFVIFNQQMEISAKAQELEAIELSVYEQGVINQSLVEIIDEGTYNNEQYAEEYARQEMDYAKKGERIFVNMD